jgi:outer membrane protein OmpU
MREKMKKLILASTALVALAGAAAAEVSISGSAEIGVVGGKDQATHLFNDVDVSFKMSGEADNGLSFGAKVDLDEAGKLGITDADNDHSAFVAYGGVKLEIGDTDGAFDAALQEVNLVGGSINDAETSHAGFSGNGGGLDTNASDLGIGLDGANKGQIATVSYAAGSFTGYASVELDNDDNDDTRNDAIYGVGAKYKAELAGVALGVGLGYQTGEAANVVGVSVDAKLANGLSAAVNYSQLKLDDKATVGTETDDTLPHIGVGAGYEMNALSIGVNYGQYSFGGEKAQSGFGVAANYDLGGGLVAQAGYGSSSFEQKIVNKEDTNLWSVGLAMSF